MTDKSNVHRPGDTLMHLNKPFAHCLIFEHKSHLCDYCFESKQLRQCSFCKFMHYCSQTCQRNDWVIHKYECASFKKLLATEISMIKDDFVRLLIRVLIRAKNNERQVTDDVGLKTLESLMDHFQNIIGDVGRASKAHKIIGIIKHVMGTEFIQSFDIKEILSYFGKLAINTFSISNYDMSQTIGSGLYLSLSTINHSCNPNCVLIFNGIQSSLKAIREFSIDSEEVSISYTEILSERKKRQDYLKEHYYFKCACLRCTSQDGIDLQMTGIKCFACSNYISELDFLTNEEEKSLNKQRASRNDCEVCAKSNLSYINKTKQLRGEQELLHAKLERKQSSPGDLIAQAQILINKLEGNPIGCGENLCFIQLCEILMDLYVEQGQLSKAKDLAIRYLINAYKLYLPQFHPTIGLMYMKIVKLAMNLNDYKAAGEFYSKAEAIVVKTHNTLHPLRKELESMYNQL